MDKKQPIIGQEASAKKENLEQLNAFLEHYKRIKNFTAGRKERLLELMQRKIAKTWKPAKKAKMVRRLTTANQLFTEAESAVDQIEMRLSQNETGPKPANNVAPFVPPPATSV